MNNKKRRVAIYVRVSTIEQAREGYSIKEQIKRLKTYCEAMGWIVVKVYVDAGISGSTIEDRPGLTDLIKEIDTFDTVLVYKLDRLSRSQKDTLYLIEDIFLNNNVDFVSMTESFDTSTAFGRAMVGILAVFAQLERENIKERMMVGKQGRAELGKFHGSKWVPIGYDYIDDRLEINKYEKMQVEKIYEMYLSGKSLTGIMKYMNAHGYKHKHGAWSHKTVRRILHSKTYMGYTRHKDEWYKGEHEAFITEEQWEKAQKRIQERRGNWNYTNRHTAALGGLCICGHCGAKYTRRKGRTHKKTGYIVYYYSCYSRAKTTPSTVKDPNCKNKIYRREELEQMVFDEVKKLAFDVSAIENIKEQYEKIDNTKEIRLIESQISELDSRLSKLIDLFSIGKMDINLIETKTTEIQNEKTALTAELKRLQYTKDQSVSEINQLANDFVNIFDSGDDDEKRSILNQLIDKIVIDNEDLKIYWKFA